MFDEPFRIRPVEADDYPAWLEMWHGYCTFYEESIPEAITQATWRRILAPDEPVLGFIAFDTATGAAAGIANCVLHPYTWSEHLACYLEDLYVKPQLRGRGAGGSFFDYLLALCDTRGWTRLYWMTRENNSGARRLYDRYTTADDFVRYVVDVDRGDEVGAGALVEAERNLT
jgi:GNAT superfamily N-acetyltransferase